MDVEASYYGGSGMRSIQLTRGQVAIVDDEDYESLSRYKWCAFWNSSTRSFYAARGQQINKSSKTIFMHRQIMKAQPGEDVDHKDHNGLNNQKANLRLATRSQNCANHKCPNACNTSGFVGVSWDKARKKWRAYVNVDRRQHHLGRYESKLAAASAYNAGSKKFFGDFAYQNDLSLAV